MDPLCVSVSQGLEKNKGKGASPSLAGTSMLRYHLSLECFDFNP